MRSDYLYFMNMFNLQFAKAKISTLIKLLQVLILAGVNWSCDSPKVNSSKFSQKAQSFLKGNELDSAQINYQKVFELDSNNIEAINALAEIHFRKVEVGKALKMLKRSVKLDSTNADIHLKLAEIQLLLGNYGEAFNGINKGLRIDERKPKGYFMKGVAYKYIRDTAKAISSFKTAVEIQPDYAEVYYELGLLMTLQKDSLALAYYKNGIEVSPNDQGLKLSLAWSYDLFGNSAQADKLYHKVLTDTPDYPEGKYNYAIFKRKNNELDTALFLCNEALVLDTNNYEVLNLKGLILSEMGKPIEAAEVQDKLNQIESEVGF